MSSRELLARQVNRAMQLFAQGLNLTDTEAMEIADLYEAWQIDKQYPAGKILKYGVNADGETQLYVVLQDHKSQAGWEPGVAVSLYKAIGFDDSGIPIWTQPLGSEDAYMIGDEVMHLEKQWVSDVDYNTWEPGVYGWTEKAV